MNEPTTTETQAQDKDLREFYQDSLYIRWASRIAPDPDNALQVYRLARRLYTGWLIFDHGMEQRRWSDYTPEEKADRRAAARELAVDAKAYREAKAAQE